MREIIKTTVPLVVLCLAVGLCLSYVNGLTRGPIDEQKRADAERKKKEVLGEAQTFVDVKGWEAAAPSGHAITAVSRGQKDGTTVGYVVAASPKGYGGAMDVTVGIARNGSVTGVKLGDNRETPGLGTKAGDAPFITQFAGKKIADPISLVKKAPSGNEVQAITGATISSRAVTAAVQQAAHVARELLKEEKVAP